MADTGARTLRLLSLLQHHRFWPGRELADRLEVSPRTLRRDVDRLRALGYPVQSTRGVEGGYQLGSGSTLPPLVLDDDEGVALVVGLHSAAHTGVADVAESSARALGKVMQMLPQHLRHEAEALRTVTVTASWSAIEPDVSLAVLSAVAQACRDTVRLRFGYTARDGAVTERCVEPYRLVTLGRRWYLLAYDMDRADWRTFRVDRLRDPDPARNSFAPRPLPADDVAAYVRSSIEQAAPTIDVELLVSTDAASLRRVIGPWGSVTEEAGARCRVHMATDSLDWAVLVLGAVDAPFEVVNPPELVDHLHAVAGRLATATLTAGRAPRRAAPRPTSARGGPRPR